MTVDGDGRGLRVDAARNHTRIVAAAAMAIEEIGGAVSLEEIARRAGVGIATLYRRFGSRDQLLRTVFEHILETRIAPTVVAEGVDPWQDLVDTLHATVEEVAQHRELLRLVKESGAVGSDALTAYAEIVEGLLARAKDAGVVRPELTPRDLAAVVLMAFSVVRVTGHDLAETRRYLALLCDGLRPGHPELPPGCAQHSG
ncbi:TetR/AcrR family transcriptional regulator [Pseudonocardia sp. CA-107938]|uniref:TetR/AcrR family transcriptional regulator n=1 Tax=Pseudonocardia sp. CA-107938 TaxID=3240021 RepID=UPI003D8DB71F